LKVVDVESFLSEQKVLQKRTYVEIPITAATATATVRPESKLNMKAMTEFIYCDQS
jgi:hypothetical protein